jgi:hypothetical protein
MIHCSPAIDGPWQVRRLAAPALRTVTGCAVALSVSCGASPLELDLPIQPGDRTLIIAIEQQSGAGPTLLAIDPALPPPALPSFQLAAGAQVFLVAYQQTLDELHLGVGPGMISPPPDGAPSRPLAPFARAEERVLSGGQDSGWGGVLASDAPALGALRLPQEQNCFEYAPRGAIDVGTTAHLIAAAALDDQRALVLLDDTSGPRWLQVGADGSATDAPPIAPPIQGTHLARGPEGTVAALGKAADGSAEVWVKTASAAAFQRLPAVPGVGTGSVAGDGWGWVSLAGPRAIWLMSRAGALVSFGAGTAPAGWGSVRAPARGGPATFGGLAAISATAADALLPHFWADSSRSLALVRGADETVIPSSDPLPFSIARSQDLGATFVGDSLGKLARFGAGGLTRLPDPQPGLSSIQAITPARAGSWRGLLYGGLNGGFFSYWEGFGFCPSTTAFAFNVGAIEPIGEDLLVLGSGFTGSLPELQVLHRLAR